MLWVSPGPSLPVSSQGAGSTPPVGAQLPVGGGRTWGQVTVATIKAPELLGEVTEPALPAKQRAQPGGWEAGLMGTWFSYVGTFPRALPGHLEA